MKYRQLMECNKWNNFFKNFVENKKQKLVPDLFLFF